MAKMKVPYDVVLPQVGVLGSTMAYREAGNPPVRIRGGGCEKS